MFLFQIMDAIIDGVRPSIPSSTSLLIKDLIEICWHADKARRPTFTDVNSMLERMSKRLEIEEIVNRPTTKRKTHPPSGSSFTSLQEMC